MLPSGIVSILVALQVQAAAPADRDVVAHAVRRYLAFALAVATTGCQMSYFAQAGDGHMKRHSYARAAANYDYALRKERLSPTQWQRIGDKRQQAIHKLVQKRLNGARGMARRNPEAALRRLASLYWSQIFGDHLARRRVLVAMTSLLQDAWKLQVEPHVKLVRYLPAAESGRRLAANFPQGHAVWGRLEKLMDHGAAHHRAIARRAGATGAAGAALAKQVRVAALHLQLARVLGDRSVVVPTLKQQNMPGVDWRMAAGRLGEGCSWVIDELARRLPQRADGTSATVLLDLATCARQQKRWVTREQMNYADWEASTDWIDQPYYQTEGSAKPCAAKCVKYDRLGVCLAREKGKACPAPKRVLRTRKVAVVRQKRVVRQAEFEVHHVRYSFALSGQARLTWRGTTTSVPIKNEQAHEDKAYWSPDRQQRFKRVNLDSMIAAAVGALQRSLVGVVSLAEQARDKQVAEHQRRQLDADTSDELSVEERYLVVVGSTGRVPQEAGAWFNSRYGLPVARLRSIQRGHNPLAGRLSPPREGLPREDHNARRAMAELRPVVSENTTSHGTRLMGGSGVDLGPTFQLIPLPSAIFAVGAAVRLRSRFVHLALEGASAHLGGQAGGVRVGLYSLRGNRRNWERRRWPFFFTWGLAFERLYSDGGDRLVGLYLPVEVRLPMGPRLTLDAGLQLNLLHIQDWAGRGEQGLYHYSPVHLGLVVHIGRRLFARVRAIHYLGAGAADPIHAHAMLGVRL